MNRPIGIFDSGVGGLIISRAIRASLPQYDYLYFGDTEHMPYGEKTEKEILTYTKHGLDFLFKNNCAIVIIACNTASAQALRKIQQEYLPEKYPDKKVLGVIVPVIEDLGDTHRVGILATRATVESKSFTIEISKLFPRIIVYEQMAPELASLIEHGKIIEANTIAHKYIDRLLSHKIHTLILGCTHYPMIKDRIRKLCGDNIGVISQDEIVPKKLEEYFKHHPEIESKLSRGGTFDIRMSATNPYIQKLTWEWMPVDTGK